jgi:hypothetical protein
VTKAKISEYSATAGDNTDVNGTNIAEGCAPSGINDAIREVMAALKRFETGADGDSVTVGGNLVVSGSTTANTLSTTVLQSDTISEKTSAAGVTIDGVLLKDNGVVTGAGTVSAPVYSTTGDTNTGIFFPAADTIAFAEGGAEAMRIDSDGDVGIGTSSPNLTSFQKAVTLGDGTGTANRYAYEINGGQSNADSSIGDFNVYNKGSLVSRMLTVRGSADNSGVLTFFTSNAGTSAERMRIDSSGNVGIGVTPSAWSAITGLQIKSGFFGNNSTLDRAYLLSNAYNSSTGWKYINSNAALRFDLEADTGTMVWLNAASGTAGNAITWSERARITSGGYFKASSTGSYNSSTDPYHELRNTGNFTTALITNASTSGYSNAVHQISFTGYTPNSASAWFLYCSDTTNQKAGILTTGTFQSRTSTYGGVSDIKLKQDIVDANSQWDDIKNLRVRKFRFKDEVAADSNYPAHLGLIAQEAEVVSPGLVYETPDMEEVEVTDEEGNVTKERQPTGTVTKSVKYSILYMKAVKALQEAMERIETLEAKVSALEAK